eukprot:COSAG01_NODE_35402_length_531_cov_1.217090_2_plen_33_part_01
MVLTRGYWGAQIQMVQRRYLVGARKRRNKERKE